MADHQPAMRAQHREMIGDRLGVGRADADIDEGDAAIGRRRAQMVGRHLVAMPGRAGDDGSAIVASVHAAAMTPPPGRCSRT